MIRIAAIALVALLVISGAASAGPFSNIARGLRSVQCCVGEDGGPLGIELGQSVSKAIVSISRDVVDALESIEEPTIEDVLSRRCKLFATGEIVTIDKLPEGVLCADPDDLLAPGYVVP